MERLLVHQSEVASSHDQHGATSIYLFELKEPKRIQARGIKYVTVGIRFGVPLTYNEAPLEEGWTHCVEVVDTEPMLRGYWKEVVEQ